MLIYYNKLEKLTNQRTIYTKAEKKKKNIITK